MFGRYPRPVSLSRRIVTALEAEPFTSFCTRQIAKLLGEPSERELAIGSTLRALHRRGWVARPAPGLYQARVRPPP
jgi:hypothetical protein